MVVAVGGNALTLQRPERAPPGRSRPTPRRPRGALRRCTRPGWRVVVRPRQRTAGRQPRDPAGGRDRPGAGPAAALTRRHVPGAARLRPRPGDRRSTRTRLRRCVVSHVTVDPADAGLRPSHQADRPVLQRGAVAALSRERGWTMVEDSGRGYRRVVPSPRPIGTGGVRRGQGTAACRQGRARRRRRWQSPSRRHARRRGRGDRQGPGGGPDRCWARCVGARALPGSTRPARLRYPARAAVAS